MSNQTLRDKIHKYTRKDAATGCWIWSKARNRDGYGHISVGTSCCRFAHRVAYEVFVGPIPEGMEIDHVCWQPACCNPDHLKLATPLENRRRQRSALATQCVNGHPLMGANVRIRSNGTSRQCRTCAAIEAKRYRLRRRQAA